MVFRTLRKWAEEKNGLATSRGGEDWSVYDVRPLGGARTKGAGGRLGLGRLEGQKGKRSYIWSVINVDQKPRGERG